MSIINLIIAFLITTTFISFSAKADFKVQKDYCTISNNFVGVTSDNIEYDGVVNISFTSDKVILPLINVSLSRNIKPTNVSLSWSDADLEDSKQRPIFEAAFQERLATEKNSVFELNKEGYIYYSKPYGFYRFQHFIALFLSQNHFKISFINEENNQIEEQIVPLTGSDQAFREVIYHCYPEAVTEFINSDLTRKKPVHQSWTVGYGITNFFKYEDLLPDEARFPKDITNLLTEESSVSYKKLSEIYSLLVLKSEVQGAIQSIEQQSDYVTLRKSIEESADKVLALGQQRDLLGGPEGSLKKLEMDLEIINSKIQTTESSVEIYKKQLSPIAEKKEQLKLKVYELQQKLTLIETNISKTKETNEQYKNNILSISALLKKYSEEYKISKDDEVKVTQLGVPYTTEAILESSRKIDELNLKNQDLVRVLNLISALDSYLVELVSSHQTALGLFDDISELKIQRVKKSEEYSVSKLNEALFMEDIVGLDFKTITDLMELNKSDVTHTSNLKNGDLKKTLQEQIKTKYNEYDLFIDELRASETDIISMIVCKTDSFLKTYKGQCLNPKDINDIKKIEVYLDQLDSSQISQLNYVVTGQNSQIQRYDSSLISLMTAKVSEQLKNESSENIIKLWNDILYVRWKYSFIKPLKDEDMFNIKWSQALKKQKDDFKKIMDFQGNLVSEIVQLDSKISSLGDKFTSTESAYFESLSKNQSLILNEVQRSQIDAAAINLSCLLDIKNVDLCVKDVEALKAKSSDESKTINAEIRSTVTFLVLASRSQLTALEDNLSTSLKQLESLLNEKEEYIQETKFEAEVDLYESVNTDYSRQMLRLKSLYEQQSEAQSKRDELMARRSSTKSELETLIQQIQTLTSEMQPTLVKLKPLCEQQNKNLNYVSKLDAEVYQLLNLSKTPSMMSSLCQISY